MTIHQPSENLRGPSMAGIGPSEPIRSVFRSNELVPKPYGGCSGPGFLGRVAYGCVCMRHVAVPYMGRPREL